MWRRKILLPSLVIQPVFFRRAGHSVVSILIELFFPKEQILMRFVE
jgi:hypothetical protein